MIYCAGGKRSTNAAQALRSKGYIVYELTGGLNKWKLEGRPVIADEAVPPFTSADYEKMIQQSSTVLVDFGAPWCPPCRKMEPVLAELQKSLPGTFVLQEIDGGIHTDLMKSLDIEAFPHFFVYKKGVKVWEKQGIVSIDELRRAIQ
jgi:thioredoxin-like negative regulator of GroEL